MRTRADIVAIWGKRESAAMRRAINCLAATRQAAIAYAPISENFVFLPIFRACVPKNNKNILIKSRKNFLIMQILSYFTGIIKI